MQKRGVPAPHVHSSPKQQQQQQVDAGPPSHALQVSTDAPHTLSQRQQQQQSQDQQPQAAEDTTTGTPATKTAAAEAPPTTTITTYHIEANDCLSHLLPAVVGDAQLKQSQQTQPKAAGDATEAVAAAATTTSTTDQNEAMNDCLSCLLPAVVGGALGFDASPSPPSDLILDLIRVPSAPSAPLTSHVPQQHTHHCPSETHTIAPSAPLTSSNVPQQHTHHQPSETHKPSECGKDSSRDSKQEQHLPNSNSTYNKPPLTPTHHDAVISNHSDHNPHTHNTVGAPVHNTNNKPPLTPTHHCASTWNDSRLLLDLHNSAAPDPLIETAAPPYATPSKRAALNSNSTPSKRSAAGRLLLDLPTHTQHTQHTHSPAKHSNTTNTAAHAHIPNAEQTQTQQQEKERDQGKGAEGKEDDEQQQQSDQGKGAEEIMQQPHQTQQQSDQKQQQQQQLSSHSKGWLSNLSDLFRFDLKGSDTASGGSDAHHSSSPEREGDHTLAAAAEGEKGEKGDGREGMGKSDEGLKGRGSSGSKRSGDAAAAEEDQGSPPKRLRAVRCL